MSEQQPCPFTGLLFEEEDSPAAFESRGQSGLALGGRAAPWIQGDSLPQSSHPP